MPNTIKIAIAQTYVQSADEGPAKLEKPHTTTPFPTLDQNLIDVSARVAEAAKLGADVVCFPEYFLQGIVNEGRQYLTFPSTHLTSFLQTLAKQHHISIVGTIVHGVLPESAAFSHAAFPSGSPFEHLHANTNPGKITPAQLEWAKWLEQHPATVEDNARPVLSNTAFFIDENGNVVGEYVKQNLWHPERLYLTPGGKQNKAFDTKWGKAGMLICWDVSHPLAAQKLVDQGVSIVFAPTYWTATDSEPHVSRHPHPDDYETSVLSALSYARSFETETVWVLSNAGGPAEEGFMGGSAVWAPLRGRVGGFPKSEVGVRLVEVDIDVLNDGRDLYKIREDASRNKVA
ncbi:putative nitrilase [Vanrija pseudolonga]|uniref:Nitrilase n=1 Tax=Vanrija pseudolonga TaxID=143232 RepID=A0AAF1BIF0_9TREE|nr:putative nitrilase [Vanrija pseudolonga]